MKENYYQILGVSPEASEKEIRRAYHQLASKYHPDKARTPEEGREYEERFALISEAYNVLKDAGRRREYDKTLGLKKEAEATMRTPPLTKEVVSPVRVQSEMANIARRAFTKGLQSYQEGDFSRATEFFEAAVRNAPAEPTYLSHLALALVKSHRELNRAMELCKKAIKLEPINMEHRIQLGEIYETIGSLTLAKKTYQEVLRWDNTNAEAQARLRALSKKKKGSRVIFTGLWERFRRKK